MSIVTDFSSLLIKLELLNNIDFHFKKRETALNFTLLEIKKIQMQWSNTNGATPLCDEQG